ncbi:SURF1 family protein [Rhodococcus sp. BP-349]|uniref:SURF1 family cytochrome oxidase biogenesis protein n=1 Tax=unclassified Rhodococcus (in: high G+C Gram-positive bacteria) TaxID=192944 RepID=UPI001C9AE640|nr:MULTISPECIES: SURF1 family protein [unclassified Rhodococcus (in: high G+C Gram-positive bacteria)]MBY6540657.1 SURF1 family protein [Rhodococcus sp. BP-363]MBY6545318.1 SURF1 family protein [Rhodococcus sp. BP-369]MBY6564548.1 SURF1 family protein [Rhodococcus sp. BP-370]MBY6578516.1 SURF1 family protein [Rhodococcus sp. BP-364]MBY6587817.1 SURF1 family protein [Rhodococcus sp. BP-358]
MRRLSFLLRPGWLALAAVVILFAYLCFSVLAPWQLGKNTSTSARNEQISRSFDAEPVDAADLLTEQVVAPEDDWRRVVVTGTYDADSDVVVRLRSVDDTPAFEVLTPFVTDAGPTILVNRGYVLPTTGIDVPAFDPPPAGTVTLEGRLRVSEPSVPDKPAVAGPGVPQVYTITPAQVGELTGTDPVDGYVQLADAQPGGLGVLALPQLDAGPYLSYGLQWLAFGIMAPLGLAYFVRAEIKERRRGNAESSDHLEPSDDLEPTAAPDEYDDGLDALLKPRRGLRRKSAPAAESTTLLTDRYGKKR